MTLNTLLIQLWIVLCPTLEAGEVNITGNITSMILRYEEMYCGSTCYNTSSSSIFEDILESTPSTNMPHPFPNETFPPDTPEPSCSTCFCDSECRSFGDCCSDLYIGKGDQSFQCEEIYSGTGESDTLFLVANCTPGHENYSEEVSRKCTTPNRLKHDEEVLVSLNRENQTSLTFRNKYCAQCHGYKDLQTWTVDVSCTDLPEEVNDVSDPAVIFARLQNSYSCMVGQRKPRNISTRSCTVLELISECNVTGIWQEYNSDIEAACHAYTHVFRDYYRNVFCYICNENEIRQLSMSPMIDYEFISFVSFAAILQFEDESGGTSSSGEECSKREYDDIFTSRCLAILCPSFYQLYQKECTFPTGMVDRDMPLYYVVKLHLIPTDTDNLHLGNSTLDLLSRGLRDYYGQQATLNRWYLDKFIVSLYRDNSSTADGTTNEEHTHAQLGENDAVASDDGHENISLSPDQYSISRIDIDLYATYSSEDYANFFESLSNLLFEEFSVSVEGRNFSFRAVYTSMLPLVHYIKNPPEFVFQGENFSYLIDFRPFSLKYVKRNCAQVLYSQSDYTLISNNSVLLKENVLISEENFTLTEDLGVLVCLSTVEELRSRYEDRIKEMQSSIEQGYDVLTILTAVCLVFSMFFLFLSFLVYVLVPELRTLPGYNLMFLISSLFLAQGLFLFGAGAVSNHVICKILGVMIHYFWMVTFAWMNVCTFHVFRVFRNILSSVKLSNDKRIVLLKYGTFSYVVPAGVVTITILVNYFLSGMSTIGYSDSQASCFLNPGVITLVAFGIPAVVTVVCTGTFFACTVVALRRASTDRASVGKKETHAILNLVKLSSATGLSWVFGLLGSLFSIEAFKYAFVVLAAGQGVLIFLSFVFNKRVFKLVLVRCRPKRDRSTSYTVSGTSNTSSGSAITSK
ncbi:uncharacterized protein [Haliotis asinina]|uniref:uncharacterized protein n=1 Tax=Haliotis asinina TaxID=109174 RepID=UPI00353264C0